MELNLCDSSDPPSGDASIVAVGMLALCIALRTEEVFEIGGGDT
jgi:hypothetical protein